MISAGVISFGRLKIDLAAIRDAPVLPCLSCVAAVYAEVDISVRSCH